MISNAELLQIANANDLKIVLNYRAGHFVTVGTEIARAGPADRINDSIAGSIRGAVVLGAKRTAAQDIQFSVRAIVDVIVRALSPSLNDFHTAMAGVDRLAGAIATVVTRDMPKHLLRDDDGTVRVALDPLTFEGVMYTAFQQVHESARGHFAVCSHMLLAFTKLVRVARTDEQRRVIASHGDIVADLLKDAPASPYERAQADEHLKRLRQALTDPVGC